MLRDDLAKLGTNRRVRIVFSVLVLILIADQIYEGVRMWRAGRLPFGSTYEKIMVGLLVLVGFAGVYIKGKANRRDKPQ